LGIIEGTVQDRLDALDAAGRVYWPKSEDGTPRLKWFVADLRGVAIPDVWTDISPISAQAKERLGYPTQKPLPLLDRVISASSKEGDLVLDPFCGWGTTIHAAQKLGRAWIGIDITHLAISLIERRLKDAFPGVAFEVHGTPKDLDSAIDLARRDKYQFQWWTVSLVDARPYGGKRKGADGGIDGILFFHSGKDKTEKALISVKGGDNVGVGMVRDLIAVVEREKAAVGVLISLAFPTRAMEPGGRRCGPLRVAAVRSGGENSDHHPRRTLSRHPAAHPAHRFGRDLPRRRPRKDGRARAASLSGFLDPFWPDRLSPYRFAEWRPAAPPNIC
jgi:DNA methylase/Restriction endonuclease